MSKIRLLQLGCMVAAAALVAVEAMRSRRGSAPGGMARAVLAAVAAGNLLFVGFLCVNHIAFPLNLDLMEGTVLEHCRRAANFQAIYPEPTPAYVPLAYNPLFYVLAVPFGWILGVTLPTLRLVAILGMVGSGFILFRTIREKTSSRWWGLIGAGLFAAAYSVMDAYLDTAHSDSWLVFSALLGTYIIDRNRSRRWNILGVLVLVASFWFKQHGALFAIGGVAWLTWREGFRRSVPYWLVACLFGPVLYILGGPLLFGSHFHYFTWEVPREWSEVHLGTFVRYAKFIVKSYPLLAAAALFATASAGRQAKKDLSVWHVQFVFAMLTGLMGSLDIGSSNNVYIPVGTWFILVGVLGIHEFGKRREGLERLGASSLLLFVSFALLLYNPLNEICSFRASESYDDLVAELNGVDGTVYAPSLGQLQEGYVLYPAAHWVALEDMLRGPGKETRDHPTVRRLLQPVIEPNGPTYILSNYPLDDLIPALAFLTDYYVLAEDYEDRFKPLRVLPGRWDHAWPRYLYRYDAAKAVADE